MSERLDAPAAAAGAGVTRPPTIRAITKNHKYWSVSLDRAGLGRPERALGVMRAVTEAAGNRCWLRGRRERTHWTSTSQEYWWASTVVREDTGEVAAALVALDRGDEEPGRAYVQAVITELRALAGTTARERWLLRQADVLTEYVRAP